MALKKVTLTVDMTVEIEEDVEPNDVTFDIPIEQVKPQANGKTVGVLVSYTTQEYFGE